jgi:SAM-dependent methyltransferase
VGDLVLTGRSRLYGDLARWFPLITAPEEYADEAEVYRQILVEAGGPIDTVLELGSGGGNNASHLKRHFTMTLTDLSPDMLAISRSLNPECEHVQGDMRTLRLGREFDAVFVHDAIDYMITVPDLRAAIDTAFLHCRPGGVALFVPDEVKERFRARTDHGGNDDGDRGARYLEWTWDPDADDDTYVVDFAYLLRDGEDVTVEHDRHVCGLFPRARWLDLLGEAGFLAQGRAIHHADQEVGAEAFIADRPG